MVEFLTLKKLIVKNLMSNSLKTILIVGLGSIGKRHLRLLREISADLNLVVLRRAESLLNDEPDADYIVTNLKDALAHKPEAAIICNPSSQHLEISIALVIPFLVRLNSLDLTIRFFRHTFLNKAELLFFLHL